MAHTQHKSQSPLDPQRPLGGTSSKEECSRTTLNTGYTFQSQFLGLKNPSFSYNNQINPPGMHCILEWKDLSYGPNCNSLIKCFLNASLAATFKEPHDKDSEL